MRVTIVSCVYPPEPIVSSRTSAEIANALAARGDEVTVITSFPNRPGGVLFRGYSRRPFRIEKGNPRVIRCLGTLSRSSRLLSRLAENISFGISSTAALLLTRKADVVYSNSWPVFATAMVRGAAAIRGIPLVISVQDLFPESLILLGKLSPKGWMTRLLYAMDRWIASGCRAVIVISEGFGDAHRRTRGTSEPRLHVISNWGDDEVVLDAERSLRFRERLSISAGERLVAFAGNIGLAAGADRIVEAARLIEAESPMRILIAGSGSESERVRALAAALPSGRVVVHSPWPKEETADLLGAADVFLLPTAGEQSLASVPSKLIAYFLAGRPVLAVAVAGSDLARTIQMADAGWVVPPDDPAALAAALDAVAHLPAEHLAALGANGARYARQNMSRQRCLPAVLNVIDAVAGAPV